ncbi:hypothetical protein FZEAL_2519 [Fusarium zealandicum]|uniref:CFEM domain-containing protein n=1 Tax=Fusarium zealandicum TaxID=1053134 RepID=A0A8H4UR36_9HYPO|nr:hypothetical protein FZEAL_2519 [Fusarium zealandicum]
MKTVFFLVASLVSGSALAQSSGSNVFPKCAQKCVLNAIENSGGCAQTDPACVCKSKNFGPDLSSCINAACEASDAAAALSTANQLCAAAGAPVTLASGTQAPSTMASAPIPPPVAPTTGSPYATKPVPAPEPIVPTPTSAATAPPTPTAVVPTAGAGADWSPGVLVSVGLACISPMLLAIIV